MAAIVQIVEGKREIRQVPGETRILKELRRVFPGAHFARAMLAPPGKSEPVACVELRYSAKGSQTPVSICAVEVDPNPDTSALTPIALMRKAFRAYGYDTAIEQIRSGLDRIWRFRYEPIQPSEAEQNQPAAPEQKEPDHE